MNYTVTLAPTGMEISVPEGTRLRDILFEQGVEFPCGGNGRCRGCRVHVAAGDLLINKAQRERLTAEELEAGWRLACQCVVKGDVTLELGQWEAAILLDHASFAFVPTEGLGVAVDVGTTTVVAQLVDMATGRVLAVRSGWNPQARHGADVMSRVHCAMEANGQRELAHLIREKVGQLIVRLLKHVDAPADRLRRVLLVGNTVMHHLFCGIPITPMAYAPFEPEVRDHIDLSPTDLGWALPDSTRVRFLGPLGSFVGSDVLAGLLATGAHESDDLTGLVDLGTNGEIVLGNRHGLLCASTAAGPAFEGARISMGMRASTGAIFKVRPNRRGFHTEVLGNVAPRGICGSGLVDAIAAGLQTGAIGSSGRLAGGAKELQIAGDVAISQPDIRQMQLAKGAIAAGVRILLAEMGVGAGAVRQLHLAGAFGNYVDLTSAGRIGLLPLAPSALNPAGNTALRGAKIALCTPDWTGDPYAALRQRMTHVGLNENPQFQDIYVEEMLFPE